MTWLITILLGLVAAYAILCLAINNATSSGNNTPYWLLLACSIALIYLTWTQPIRNTLT